MTTERYRHRRTRGSGPPPDLLWGEIAYSDGDESIHVGRHDGTTKSFTTNPAPTNHTHDYAPTNHTHDYAPANHTHDYAPANHSHPSYAVIESGLWTPTYIMSTSGAVVPNIAVGDYFKLGNLIIFSATLRSASLSSPVGSVRISLPFPAAISGPEGWPLSITPSAWATSMPEMTAVINNPNFISLTKHPSNAPVTFVVATDLAGTANANLIRLSGWYRQATA